MLPSWPTGVLIFEIDCLDQAVLLPNIQIFFSFKKRLILLCTKNKVVVAACTDLSTDSRDAA